MDFRKKSEAFVYEVAKPGGRNDHEQANRDAGEYHRTVDENCANKSADGSSCKFECRSLTDRGRQVPLRSTLNRGIAPITVTNTNRFRDVVYKDFSVADFARTRGYGDSL